LNIAWCGDSQLCLVKNGHISYLTKPHKPSDQSEQKRIDSMGGSVSFISNAWRVSGILGVARSFGDVEYQPSVTCEPDIKHINLDGSEDYLIIACDGLWDTLNLEDMCEFIYELRNDSNVNIAEELAKKAKENGSSDNITVIFILLKDNLTQISEPILHFD
jgi:protein phosphatase 1E